MKYLRFPVILFLLAFALTVSISTAFAHGGRPLSTTLTGTAEIGGGDPDGSGSASITLNEGQSKVCFHITV
jgi:hypothetical protein